MNALEARYRDALRWYPRAWREANGDAVVGTLLDAAESEGRNAAKRADLLNLVASGLATRFGVVAGSGARSLIAANALATGIAYSLTQFFTTSWAPLAPAMKIGIGTATFGPFFDLGPILTALWIGAAIGALLGRPVLTRSAAVAVVLTAGAMEVVRTIHYSSGSLSRFALLFHASLALLALIGRFDRRRPLGLLLAGWLAVFVLIDLANGVWIAQSSLYLWALGPANAAGLTMALAATCLVAGGLANVRRPQAAAVLLLSSLPWLLMWAIELATDPDAYFEFPFPLYAIGLLATTYGVCAALLRRCSRRTTPAD